MSASTPHRLAVHSIRSDAGTASESLVGLQSSHSPLPQTGISAPGREYFSPSSQFKPSIFDYVEEDVKPPLDDDMMALPLLGPQPIKEEEVEPSIPDVGWDSEAIVKKEESA
ncbi:hypothetical protein FOMPIDRAFT_117713 [Fomitopsis schrenkii]|uniref:Uncharacterized protein n=1 Tax=Fomitopsis schrenkii TaxID=2126942 RepID=S8DJB2_FOMSC|nr:hypothetical protein FOMPIDRAFT_117713 [Fomitopsis schrenkii]